MLCGTVQAAEVKVLASGAVKEAALELFPQFEKSSGNKVAVTWAGTVDIKKKIAAGEVFDLVIVASPELDAFAKDGKIVAGSKVDLVRSSVGVAVKAGAPKPDLKSGDDLKKALLAAKSVGYSTGPSGVYMQGLFEKMGIADEIKAKAKVTQPGRAGCDRSIRSGEAEIGFQQVSELIHEAGIDFLGPIPADVQNITVFSSGVHDRRQGADRSQGVAEIPDRARGGPGHQEAWSGAAAAARRRRADASAATAPLRSEDATGPSGAAATGVDGGSSGSAGGGIGAAAHALEEVAERRVDAQRVAARRDHRVDLIGRQLEPRVDRVEHLGALRTELIEADAVDHELEVAAIPVRPARHSACAARPTGRSARR